MAIIILLNSCTEEASHCVYIPPDLHCLISVLCWYCLLLFTVQQDHNDSEYYSIFRDTHTHTHTYIQINVDIRNVSGSSRQMRIVPLNSPYFTVTRGWTHFFAYLSNFT